MLFLNHHHHHRRKKKQPNPRSSGIEDNPTVFYQLIRGSTDQTNKYDTFYLQQRQKNGWTHADVKVNHPLDYERIKEYNLTIRVEVSLGRIQIVIQIFFFTYEEKSLKKKNDKRTYVVG